IQPWSRSSSTSGWYARQIEAVARKHGYSADVPVKDLPQEFIRIVLYGDKEDQITLQYRDHRGHRHNYQATYEGVIPNLDRRYRETESDYVRGEIERYMAATPCPECKGARLRPEILGITVADKSIVNVTGLSIGDAFNWVAFLQGEDSPFN